MKKIEYTELVLKPEDRLHELDAEKHDDYCLPEFSKEVPISAKRKENKGDVILEYDWKESDSQNLKIKRLTIRKSEGLLSDLHRVAARDGADTICFQHNGATYVLRKTVSEVAQAIYNACAKIKGSLEDIVGYLQTVLGNDYVISKAENENWAFDKRISKGSIRYVDVDTLGGTSKSKLCELIVEKISELHASNIIMGRFTLNNLLLGREDIKFSDLRRLRLSRKRSYVIEEFKSILQYLFAIGLATREDIYCSVAYYASKNEDSCNEWYQERTGKRAKETFDLVTRMEEEVYN